MNVYDILKYNKFIITKDAVLKVEEVYAWEKVHLTSY
jgi:large subunit ribosomal protein L4